MLFSVNFLKRVMESISRVFPPKSGNLILSIQIDSFQYFLFRLVLLSVVFKCGRLSWRKEIKSTFAC